MATALTNMLLGMGTVFLVLILISAIISCFRIFPYLEQKKKNKKAQSADVMTAEPPEEQMQQDESVPDYELIAVISAAIAATTGAGTDSFIVRTIKRR